MNYLRPTIIGLLALAAVLAILVHVPRTASAGIPPTPTPTPTATPTAAPTPTPTGTPTPTPTLTPIATHTDVPNADKANPGGWTNDLRVTCAADSVSTTCSSRIDEDIDTPDDTDFIQSRRNSSNASVDFELSDAPLNLQTLTDVDVRFRASKIGRRAATVRVELRKADGTLLGLPTTQSLSAAETDFSYSISGLSLTAADVDGLFVRVVGNVSGRGSSTKVLVQTINLDKTFEAVPTPTPIGPQVSPATSPPECPPIGPPISPPVSPSLSPPVNPATSPPASPPASPSISPPVRPPISPPLSPSECPPVCQPVSPSLSPPVSPSLSPPVSPATSPPASPPISPPECSPVNTLVSFLAEPVGLAATASSAFVLMAGAAAGFMRLVGTGSLRRKP